MPDIIIGLDFGTSCTKVVLQDPSIPRAWAIPFKGLTPSNNPYLLPTQIDMDTSQTFNIGVNNVQIKDLKRRLLVPEVNSGILASAYLAKVLSHSRSYFLENNPSYQANTINWILNLGIPSVNNQKIEGIFKKTAEAAWRLSFLEKVSWEKAKWILEHADDSQSGEEVYVNLTPEVVAQTVGYAKSPMRRDDMYVLMDIGGGTLDVAVFLLRSDKGEDRYSILEADVRRYGAFEYLTHYFDLTRKQFQQWMNDNGGAMALIPSEISQSTPQPEDPYLKKCAHFLMNKIRIVYKDKNPLSSTFQKGLTLFMCGGGSNIKFYKDAVKRAEKMLTQNYHIKSLNPTTFPQPDREMLEARDLAKEDYHRISVAYGLSFEPFDIGWIVPPSQIRNLKKASQSSRIRSQNTQPKYEPCHCKGMSEDCRFCGGTGRIKKE